MAVALVACSGSPATNTAVGKEGAAGVSPLWDEDGRWLGSPVQSRSAASAVGVSNTEAPLRLLTRTQLEAALANLLPAQDSALGVSSLAGWPTDVAFGDEPYPSATATRALLSGPPLEQLHQLLATRVGAFFGADPQFPEVACAWAERDAALERQCRQEPLRSFLERAFRRPVSDPVFEIYARLDHREAVLAALLSPRFLYWGSPPDPSAADQAGAPEISFAARPPVRAS